jgi:hypothetical protein
MDDSVQRTDADDLIWIKNRKSGCASELPCCELTHYVGSVFTSEGGSGLAAKGGSELRSLHFGSVIVIETAHKMAGHYASAAAGIAILVLRSIMDERRNAAAPT